jgi:hypothetical protein
MIDTWELIKEDIQLILNFEILWWLKGIPFLFYKTKNWKKEYHIMERQSDQ